MTDYAVICDGNNLTESRIGEIEKTFINFKCSCKTFCTENCESRADKKKCCDMPYNARNFLNRFIKNFFKNSDDSVKNAPYNKGSCGSVPYSADKECYKKIKAFSDFALSSSAERKINCFGKGFTKGNMPSFPKILNA